MTFDIRRLVKRILPVPLVGFVRALKMTPPVPVWDGVYAHLHDVPTTGGTYDDDRRIDESLRLARAELEVARGGGSPALWHDSLGVLAGAVLAGRSCISILDFGGGVGTAYIQLLASLPKTAAIRYRVIEQKNTCVAGRRLFDGDSRIQFDTSLPELGDAPDIVYVNSALPYIADYAGLLRNLAGLGARYLLLARLAAGKFPTYATRQLNLSGQVLPYWFLNAEEVKEILRQAGYSLAYDAASGPEYNQDNFPESHRIGRMRTQLFVGSRGSAGAGEAR